MEKDSSNKLSQLAQSFTFLNIPIPEEKFHFIEIGTQISVLSFNILADAYCYESDKSNPESPFNFANRSALVIETIKKADSDICILQEVDNMDSFWYHFKDLGYEINYQYRTRGGDWSQGADCVVVMYKKQKFEMIKYEGLILGEGHPFTEDQKYNTSNVGLCVELVHKESQKKIVVLGCHLYWDPDLEQVKFLQVCMILDCLQEKYNNGEIIFWGGDLNLDPRTNSIAYIGSRDEPVYDKLEKKDEQIMEDHLKIYKAYHSEDSKSIKFENLYSFYGRASGKEEAFPKYTTYTYHYKATLDHIFFDPRNTHPIKLLKIDEEAIEKTNGLPCKGLPSDHVPIMGIFLI